MKTLYRRIRVHDVKSKFAQYSIKINKGKVTSVSEKIIKSTCKIEEHVNAELI